ncbi:inorganic pyrophosphatase 2-like [Magnolia sinica]|uniref:inorganic pyrophosphatase 2-like n=1 Tax=Magnolia sinica TaxID=86752 RepID=UPI00265AA877|nr:inorganic pyrophosphatase 2-like [Magnolia sinica]
MNLLLRVFPLHACPAHLRQLQIRRHVILLLEVMKLLPKNWLLFEGAMKEIAECLKRVPLHPQIITAIKSAMLLGCDLRIVSDANVCFIETILKQHGLFDYFSEINTNPTFIDEDGKFRILPYHDCASSPHGCDLCPPIMCKVCATLQTSGWS